MMKRIKNRRLFIYAVIGIIWTTFIAATCNMDPTYPIRVYNTTDHYVDVLMSHGDPLYPDTLLPNRRYDMLYPVQSGSVRDYGLSIAYKKFIQSYGSDTIIIFIFHTDTLSKYTWEEIRDGYKILKRYDVSWQEMERLKGRLYYPPTEDMKNMKMYPPYGSE